MMNTNGLNKVGYWQRTSELIHERKVLIADGYLHCIWRLPGRYRIADISAAMLMSGHLRRCAGAPVMPPSGFSAWKMERLAEA
jgi:hypothetical protein